MFSKNSFRFLLLSSLLLVNYSVKDDRQPIEEKAIVNCVDIPDPMLFSTVSICGSKIDTYEIPPKIEHLYGVSDLDSYLKNIDWIYRNSKNRIVTKDSKKKLSYYDVFLPNGMVNSYSYQNYAIGIISPLLQNSSQIPFSTMLSIDYNFTVTNTTGDSSPTEFTSSFNSSLGGLLSNYTYSLEEKATKANTFYVANSTSVSASGHCERQSDAPSPSWRIEKYRDYFPVKIEKIKKCSEYGDSSVCNGRKNDSYVSDVFYKLVPLNEYEIIQSFKTTGSESQREYRYWGAASTYENKYPLLSGLESIRGFRHVRLENYL